MHCIRVLSNSKDATKVVAGQGDTNQSHCCIYKATQAKRRRSEFYDPVVFARVQELSSKTSSP